MNIAEYEKQILASVSKNVKKLQSICGSAGNISDGYHTFNELYYHRCVLFSIICNQNKDKAWKSRQHNDGSMYDNMFIVGISTPKGDYTYHYDLSEWCMFDVEELDRAPVWDGHLPSDINRLLSL